MPRFSNEPLTSESSTAETRTGKARLAKARAIGNFFIEVRVIFRGEAYGKHSSYRSCPAEPSWFDPTRRPSKERRAPRRRTKPIREAAFLPTRSLSKSAASPFYSYHGGTHVVP